MKQHDIGFRDLLERLLPLDELPPIDRRAVQSALLSGVAAQIEQAALLALRRLEEVGALTRLEPSSNGGGPVLRFQARDALHVFTLHLPGPIERDGVRFIPRASLPVRAPAGMAQVRRLLRIDDPVGAHDPRSGPAHDLLAQQLASIGRELLGAAQVRFVARAATETAGVEGAIHPELAARALRDPDLLAYCPDLSAAPALREVGRRREIGSLVLIGVPASADACGHLEVAAGPTQAFDDDALALIALIADSFAAARERASRLEQIVFVDPLTAVYNRPYFDLQLHNEIARARREQASLGLCLVDIDDFKAVNTRYGYEAGNQVLITVAQTLKGGVRPFDTTSRWGGEEFALLLTPPVSAADAQTVSERLRGLVERLRVDVEGLDGAAHAVGITVSIGVALFPAHGQTPQELWRAANWALLEAKRPPKNRVVFFEPGSRKQP
jgi:diguanylate cyclase (GGDEF)-like protein